MIASSPLEAIAFTEPLSKKWNKSQSGKCQKIFLWMGPTCVSTKVNKAQVLQFWSIKNFFDEWPIPSHERFYQVSRASAWNGIGEWQGRKILDWTMHAEYVGWGVCSVECLGVVFRQNLPSVILQWTQQCLLQNTKASARFYFKGWSGLNQCIFNASLIQFLRGRRRELSLSRHPTLCTLWQ